MVILTGVAHRPASVASQRHVPTPRHSIPSIRGSASRSINQGFKRFHPSDLPLACDPRMETGTLGLEPRASHPALTGDARRGGDRPSSTSLKHALRHRHRPSLQSCVFTQCVRPRVARDKPEVRETGRGRLLTLGSTRRGSSGWPRRDECLRGKRLVRRWCRRITPASTMRKSALPVAAFPSALATATTGTLAAQSAAGMVGRLVRGDR